MGIPTLHGNWIDLIILVVLLFYVLERSFKGFIDEFIDVVTFLFSLLLALKFYPVAATFFKANFSLSRGFSNALGFLTIAFISEFVLYLVSSYFEQYIDKKIIRSKANAMLGFVPAILSGLILVAFLLTTLLTLPIRPDVKQAIVESKIGGFLTKRTLGLERSLSDVFGGAVQDTLNFLTVKPQGNEVVDLRFRTQEFSIDEASEARMFELVNVERQKNGIRLLRQDTGPLREVARNHCIDMFARGYFSHYTPEGLSPFDRMQAAHIDFTVAGENLAYAPTVEIAHEGLMQSPGHRANILSNQFGKLGIGVISAGIYGRMFCQEFTD